MVLFWVLFCKWCQILSILSSYPPLHIVSLRWSCGLGCSGLLISPAVQCSCALRTPHWLYSRSSYIWILTREARDAPIWAGQTQTCSQAEDEPPSKKAEQRSGSTASTIQTSAGSVLRAIRGMACPPVQGQHHREGTRVSFFVLSP